MVVALWPGRRESVEEGGGRKIQQYGWLGSYCSTGILRMSPWRGIVSQLNLCKTNLAYEVENGSHIRFLVGCLVWGEASKKGVP